MGGTTAVSSQINGTGRRPSLQCISFAPNLLPWLDSGRMEIWVHRNGQYAGRFSESAIREKVADGSLSATDLAWDEAKSAWKPISELLPAFPSERLGESRISDAAL